MLSILYAKRLSCHKLDSHWPNHLSRSEITKRIVISIILLLVSWKYGNQVNWTTIFNLPCRSWSWLLNWTKLWSLKRLVSTLFNGKTGAGGGICRVTRVYTWAGNTKRGNLEERNCRRRLVLLQVASALRSTLCRAQGRFLSWRRPPVHQSGLILVSFPTLLNSTWSFDQPNHLYSYKPPCLRFAKAWEPLHHFPADNVVNICMISDWSNHTIQGFLLCMDSRTID